MNIVCRVCKGILFTLHEEIDQKQIDFHNGDIAPHEPRGIKVSEIYMCSLCSHKITEKWDKNGKQSKPSRKVGKKRTSRRSSK